MVFVGSKGPKGVPRVRRCPNRACQSGWVNHPSKWGVKVKCTACGGKGYITQRYAS